MSGIREQLAGIWPVLARSTAGGREWRAQRLQCDGPTPVLAAVRDGDGGFALLIEAPLAEVAKPIFRFRASGVSVDDQRRPDEGLRRLAIVLELPELLSVFETLAVDMVEIVSATVSMPEAFRQATNRLEAWQACLNARRGQLSAEQQIGLMGELEVLRFVAAEIGFPAAIDAWQGPFDGLHDFARLGSAIEVKSVLGPGQLIRISDVDQLNRSGLSMLAVARPRFVQSDNAPNLTECVNGVRQYIADSAPAALAEFDRRLLFTGLVPTAEEPNLRARLDSMDVYLVTDGFPWIDPATVPEAVSGIRYALDERSLREFHLPMDRFRLLTRHLGGPIE